MVDIREEVVITFFSHYEAVKAKRIVGKGSLIPVPRSLSSSCGTALRTDLSVFMAHHEFDYDKAYLKKGDSWSVLQV